MAASVSVSQEMELQLLFFCSLLHSTRWLQRKTHNMQQQLKFVLPFTGGESIWKKWTKRSVNFHLEIRTAKLVSVKYSIIYQLFS